MVRVPALVVRSVRDRSPRVSDHLLRGQLCRLQRDVLFPCYLHEHTNRKFALVSEGLRLRLLLLVEKLRTILEEGGVLGLLHLDRLRLKDPDFRRMEGGGAPHQPLPRAGPQVAGGL